MNNDLHQEAIGALREYVQDDNPKVNLALRENYTDTRATLLDSLFTTNDSELILYRGLPNSCIKIVDHVYKDAGFLSTSKSINDPLFRFTYSKDDAALLIISVPKGVRIIDVNEVLDNSTNNEEEVILPHHLQLLVKDITVYSSNKEVSQLSISDFERKYSEDLLERLFDFETITVYYLQYPDFF